MEANPETTIETKEAKAMQIVRRYIWWSMGAGLIPIPLLDLATVTGVQMKMISEISKVYEIEFHESRGKALFGSLIGSVVPASLSFGTISPILKAIPVVGAVIGAPSMVLFSGATAYALGKVFIQHFEAGGTFLDLEPEKVREYFRKQFDEGQKIAATMDKTQPATETASPERAKGAEKAHHAAKEAGKDRS
ncbi:MAG TPA: DUF697 domain-containing protein [Candidatus Ozemobacteraceae bacterium]|nr:DUF697 domain-containing protein [Candidatus Ozemobacteraceae bacterium]